MKMRQTFVLLVMGSSAVFAQTSPVSGKYGSLTLTINGAEVSGVFSESRVGNGTQAAPQFTCEFLLRGHLHGSRALIQTWYPGEAPIEGNLSFEGGRVSLLLRDDHGGCGMTVGDMVHDPYRAELDKTGTDWNGVALITAARAVFRPTPGVSALRAPYVVEGDTVVVLQQKSGWVYARYVAGDHSVTGWLRAAELAVAAVVPQRR